MDAKLKQRVIYRCLLLPVRLGLLFELPMKDFVDLLQMQAFHETRRRGLKMKEVSALLDVSMRKVSQLSKRLRLNFAQAEQEVALPRRIEFMLWAEPMTDARIKQVLRPMPEEEVTTAIEQLLLQERVEAFEDSAGHASYRVLRSQFRLVSEDWLDKLDALNNLLSMMANVVDARFFHDDPRAFARTISLRVRGQDMEKLQRFYQEQLWPFLVELDEAAHDDEQAEQLDISLLWAPYEYIQDKLQKEEDA